MRHVKTFWFVLENSSVASYSFKLHACDCWRRTKPRIAVKIQRYPKACYTSASIPLMMHNACFSKTNWTIELSKNIFLFFSRDFWKCRIYERQSNIHPRENDTVLTMKDDQQGKLNGEASPTNTKGIRRRSWKTVKQVPSDPWTTLWWGNCQLCDNYWCEKSMAN